MTDCLVHRVTLDPGIRGCGLALFGGPTLTRATYTRNPLRAGCDGTAIAAMVRALIGTLEEWRLGCRAEVYAELPQVYTWGKGKGDPNDLLPLAAIVGGLVSYRPWVRITTYKPREWKGTISGDHLVAQISKRGPGAILTEPEHARTEPPCASLAHNMWDAVGIGLFSAGRLRQRVYPGAA